MLYSCTILSLGMKNLLKYMAVNLSLQCISQNSSYNAYDDNLFVCNLEYMEANLSQDYITSNREKLLMILVENMNGERYLCVPHDDLGSGSYTQFII